MTRRCLPLLPLRVLLMLSFALLLLLLLLMLSFTLLLLLIVSCALTPESLLSRRTTPACPSLSIAVSNPRWDWDCRFGNSAFSPACFFFNRPRRSTEEKIYQS